MLVAAIARRSATRPLKRGIADRHAIHVDHRPCQSCLLQQGRDGRGLNAGMDVGRGPARHAIGRGHGRSQQRQRVAARHRADQQSPREKRGGEAAQGFRKRVDGIERADRQDQVEAACGRRPIILDHQFAAGRSREHGAGFGYIDRGRKGAQTRFPAWVGAAQQQCALPARRHDLEPLQAVGEGPFEQEQLGPGPRRAIAPPRARQGIEQLAHQGCLCGARASATSRRW